MLCLPRLLKEINNLPVGSKKHFLQKFTDSIYFELFSVYFESFAIKGTVKCEQYWPELDQSLVFDHMVIKTLEETEVKENEFYQRRLQIEGKFFSSSTCFR